VSLRSLSFHLRGLKGRVRVQYDVNDDPTRWGYGRLGVGFDIDAARGFPVVEARVEYPGEGYAGFLGWIQVVRYWVGEQREPTVVAPDVAPQMKESAMPYLSFGIAPVLFDAPAFTERNVVWKAWSFLTQTPDLLMSRIVEPVCGFRWGYEISDGIPTVTPLAAAQRADWLDVMQELRAQLPNWTFSCDEWEPPDFDQ
jgi:hypothetical protein